MSAHTPGPWGIDDDWTIRSADTSQIGTVYSPDDFPCYEPEEPSERSAYEAECEANARLIAAAPDLLAALEEMTSKGEGCAACGDGTKGGCGCRYERARAAIAKVRGE